jgi:hypothetical protein
MSSNTVSTLGDRVLRNSLFSLIQDGFSVALFCEAQAKS